MRRALLAGVDIGTQGTKAAVYDGKDGRSRPPYDAWLDTRCEPDILRMRETAASLVLEKTGGSPGYNHGPKILWLKRTRPDIYREVRAFVQPAAYVAMR